MFGTACRILLTAVLAVVFAVVATPSYALADPAGNEETRRYMALAEQEFLTAHRTELKPDGQYLLMVTPTGALIRFHTLHRYFEITASPELRDQVRYSAETADYTPDEIAGCYSSNPPYSLGLPENNLIQIVVICTGPVIQWQTM